MQYKEFIQGWADEIGLEIHDATEHWAAYSRQLSDAERNLIESGGYASGEQEARAFREWNKENP